MQRTETAHHQQKQQGQQQQLQHQQQDQQQTWNHQPMTRCRLAELESLTAGELRERYAEVFGEAARSHNRRWLHRRVAWRMQMLAEDDLAERTIGRVREKAATLARDADLRVRPPTAGPVVDNGGVGYSVGGTVPERTVAVAAMSSDRDGRIPPPGLCWCVFSRAASTGRRSV